MMHWYIAPAIGAVVLVGFVWWMNRRGRDRRRREFDEDMMRSAQTWKEKQ